MAGRARWTRTFRGISRGLEWLPGPRVSCVVDALDLGDGELGVALRGGKALVTEHLLDGAEIGPFFQHVGAERVAQGMRMDVGG